MCERLTIARSHAHMKNALRVVVPLLVTTYPVVLALALLQCGQSRDVGQSRDAPLRAVEPSASSPMVDSLDAVAVIDDLRARVTNATTEVHPFDEKTLRPSA